MAAVSGTNFSADPDTAGGEVGPGRPATPTRRPFAFNCVPNTIRKKSHPLFCTDLSTLYFFSLNYTEPKYNLR
jgi:hypothetical protein